MNEYLEEKTTEGESVVDHHKRVDGERRALIAGELGSLLDDYLAGRVPLADFKTRNDSLNKRNEYWGFKGIKGQMFFNMLVNASEDEAETDQELKAVIAVPADEETARSRLKSFQGYVRRIGDDLVEAEVHPSTPLKRDDVIERLPTSCVPPVVAILTRLAVNDPALASAAAASGTSIPRAFEKGIDAAFTVLGYDCRLLGQGHGRVPDGIAQDDDDAYAIIWDAKVRDDGYSMGTDDRAIREYVATQSRDLKRRRTLRNVYYTIVSSGFRDDFEETIRALKMETDTAEVCLLTADALIAMVARQSV